MVPLETANGPGAELLSGAGAPANANGSDGDFYVDTTNGVLYGPKANGVWPVPGVALGGVQGAASAYNVASTVITPTVAASATPITFDTDGPAAGSVTMTDPSTFTASDTGIYSVEYHLALSAVVAGTISVHVNGVQEGPNTNTMAGPNIADALLLDLVAGDTLQLMFTPTAGVTPITLGTSSIVVEQTTAG
jgi:hypothetical protein